MSINRFNSLYSQISFISRPSRKFTFAQASQLIRKESLIPEEKHTFFPGNEISRNRIEHKSKYILLSDSTFKLIWDFIIFLCTISLSLFIPSTVSYLLHPPIGIFYSVSLVYFFDILISLNLSYSENGTTVYNRNQILRKYLKTWFIVDFLSVIPLEALYEYEEYTSEDEIRGFDVNKDRIKVVMLIKLVKFIKARKFLGKIVDLSANSNFFSMLKIFLYLVLLFVMMHWMNCVFNIFYCLSLQDEYYYWPNVRYDWKNRYLSIYLRVFQTMTSIGYGDFVVKTTTERLLILIFMVFSSGFFGYFIGIVDETIQKSSKICTYFNRIKHKLLLYYEKNNLPKSVRIKINSYIRYLTYTYRNNLLQDNDIVQFLSIPLSEQIFLYTKGHMLISLLFFSSLSRQCIRAFGYKLAFRVYGPSDLIFVEGQITDELFCITSGTVQIFHQDSSTVFTDLHQEDIFGEISFILKQKRVSSARAYNFCELFALSRYDCDKILQKMPKDAEKFQTIVRNTKTYGLSFLNISCYLCGKLGHLAKSCEFFIWKPIINQKNFYTRNRKVNTAYSAKRKERKSVLINKYKTSNTIGKHNIEDYNENPYLYMKAKEYRESSIKLENQFLRFAKIFSDNESEDGQNGDRFEEKHEKIKIFEKFSKKYTENLRKSQIVLLDIE